MYFLFTLLLKLCSAGMGEVEMIGTMTNTLILAFAGETLATLVVFRSYGIPFDQLISSDFTAMGISGGIAGNFGIGLTVPMSALVCSYILNKK